MKTIEISFEPIVLMGAFVFFLIGFALTAFAIYMVLKNNKFKKNGIPIKLKVKDVKEDIRENGIKAGYTTTFEFELDGQINTEILRTGRKFKIGSSQKGVILNKEKDKKISVAGEGFYLSPFGATIMIVFGLLFMWLFIWMLLDLPNSAIIVPTIASFLCIILYIKIYPLFFKKNRKSKNKRKEKLKEAYYNNVEDEYSTVSASLVRYIPKIKKGKQKEKIDIGTIFLVSILVFAGIACTFIGIVGANELIDIKSNWILTTGTIKDIYIYTYTDTDGHNQQTTGMVCEYQVNKIKYELDKKKLPSFKKYKEGDRVKIYYDKSDPNKAELRDGLFGKLFPFVVGFIFNYSGYCIFMSEKKKVRLYKAVIVNKENKKI